MIIQKKQKKNGTSNCVIHCLITGPRSPLMFYPPLYSSTKQGGGCSNGCVGVTFSCLKAHVAKGNSVQDRTLKLPAAIVHR